LSRSEVFIANVLKCRPPGNRDPRPGEIENCTPYLIRQVELVQPRVICTLGNFATKLLRNDPTGITRVHGRAEVRTIGAHAVRLFPIYHPAAALYTPRTLESLREDFHALPGILAMSPAVAPPPEEPLPEPEAAMEFEAVSGAEPAPEPVASAVAPEQLGLF
jgi:DNA polymerase